MATATLNEALTLFGQLSGEDQEMMLEIARKRRIEAWRKETAAYAKKALRDYRSGKLKAEPVEEMLQRLHRLADQEG
ncbi:hypothetical protein LBMAG56_17010 [Verrucomicrobiota bacterium]|nr:hypothetical protein LBMAG56_17010 [Verrucomicrobiota bacterium]